MNPINTSNYRPAKTRVPFICTFIVTGLIIFCGSARPAAGAGSMEKGITNTTNSQYAKLRSIDIDDMRWTGGFWAERFEVCRTDMIPNMESLLKNPNISHAYENFLIAAGQKQGRHRGPKWNDGDFYKWLEAVAFVYGVTKDEQLDKQMDEIIEVIGKSQREDGYIHTPVIISQRGRAAENTDTEFENRLDFETYNMGHLMTCACIHYRATGKTSLLDIAKKSADYLYNFYKNSPENLANNAICPSHYMGVVEMYRTTGEPRYLELAKGLIDIRDLIKDGTDHNQDRIPFRRQTKAVGHAVRANYLYAGAADIYAETGDKSLMDALDSIWRDIAYSKVYVTGATGALYDGASPDGSRNHSAIQLVHQAYGREYQLPNVTAYNESCATVGYALWNWRMLEITAQAKFADMFELALYNGVLSTISLDGKEYFYTNALRVVEETPFELRWSRYREKYISCFCCPPNTVRTIAEAGSYAYSISDEGLWVNLYGSNILDTNLAEGAEIKLSQQTDYPWDGTIKITIEKAPAEEFSIFLRIPGWAKSAVVTVNGKTAGENIKPGQYYPVRRKWSAGDTIELNLPMPVQLLEAHPMAEEIRNEVAVQRGPIVYCLESVDLPENIKMLDVTIPPTVEFTSRFEPDLLGGVAVIEGKAHVFAGGDWSDTLYRPLTDKQPKEVDIRLIPYYVWDNRGKSEMTVWLPLR
ncbi:MAG: glycoside hydrolase family 127 protein [Sedimentisphaerales bacterium]|nr:glycoside hydrolase family 127 protein [Sedimentisphaerales bacterium]